MPWSSLPVAPARAGINGVVRSAVAQARAEGYRALTVIAVTRATGTPATDSLARALTALGGQVQIRFDEIGYVRALMPLDAIHRVASIPGVADYAAGRGGIGDRSWGGNGTIFTSRPSSINTAARNESVEGQGASINRDLLPVLNNDALNGVNPYVPRDEIRADLLAEEFPQADGRGVTIAIVEGALDFTHPALQQSRTAKGERIPKIAGIVDWAWYPYVRVDRDTDPRDPAALLPNRDSRRAIFSDSTATTTTGTVTFRGGTYQLPQPGTWKLTLWKRSTTSTSRDTTRYLVAWRDTTQLWIDLNRNSDLRDETAVPNINVQFGASAFPADSSIGATLRTPFAVAFSPTGEPAIYQAYNDHTTMVGGTAAGSNFFGGGTGGIAPGARLLLFMQGAGVEPFIMAARDPRVDIITNQASSSTFPSAHGSLMGIVFDRLAAVYRKPIFISAANAGPTLGTITSTGATGGAMAVGAYISKRSYALNDSWHVPDDDNLTLYSSRGPGNDGAMEPDFIAPTQMVTPGGCGREEPWLRTLYRLPSCYMLGSGTSNAAPFAAGAAAMLISAARAKGLPARAYDGPALTWALSASARRIPNAGLHEQGAGLIQVDSAWKLLRLALTRVQIVASAPVENAYAPYLSQPGQGPGLMLREGWTVGRKETRAITLLRMDGAEPGVRYGLRWRGNDGTFALADSSVVLARGVPASVPVTVAPKRPGIHSAAIEILDLSTGAIMTRVPTTVIAGLSLNEDNDYTVTHEESVAWPANRTLFVNVPSGTTMLHVVLEATSGTVDVHVRGPLAGNNGESSTSATPGSDGVVTVCNPMPGTWEFTIAPPSFRAPSEPTGSQRRLSYVLTATAYRAKATTTRERDGTVNVTFANEAAQLSNAFVRGELGIRNTYRGTIAASAIDSLMPVQVGELQLDSGATSFRISLETDAGDDPNRRLDLYVYSCSRDQCSPIDVVTRPDGRQEAIEFNPRAERWKIFVDPVRARGKAIAYTVRAVTTNPSFGVVRLMDVSDAMVHAITPGAKWTVPVRLVPEQSARGTGELVAVIDLLGRDALSGGDAANDDRAPVGMALDRTAANSRAAVEPLVVQQAIVPVDGK